MAYPEPPFISLNEAATKLECSMEYLRYYLEQGDLAAYGSTPIAFPSVYPSEDDFSCSIHYFWQQKLARRCRICPPFRWRKGLVECKKIIVMDECGVTPPTANPDFPLSATDGEIGLKGEMLLKSLWWEFEQESIMLNTQEVANYKLEHDENNFSWAPDANYGQPQGIMATPEQIIKRGRFLGKTKNEIAAMIDAIHIGECHLIHKDMARLFSKKKYVSEGTLVQQGRRLRGKKT